MSSAVLGALSGLFLVACSGSGPVEIAQVNVDAEARAACEALLADLPETMLGQERAEISPDDALGRAWGDPPIIATCGVEVPDDFNEFSLCDEVNGIGWFVPDSAVADLNPGAASEGDGAAVLTVITHAPRVEIRVPAEHRPPADLMVTVSDLVSEHGFEEIREPCV